MLGQLKRTGGASWRLRGGRHLLASKRFGEDEACRLREIWFWGVWAREGERGGWLKSAADCQGGGMAWARGRGCCDVQLTRRIAWLGYARGPAFARTLHCIATINQCMEGAAHAWARVCSECSRYTRFCAVQVSKTSKGVALQTEPN